MLLSWNAILSRALTFSRTWADAANEDSEAKPFWIAFFEIFGITLRPWPTSGQVLARLVAGVFHINSAVKPT